MGGGRHKWRGEKEETRCENFVLVIHLQEMKLLCVFTVIAVVDSSASVKYGDIVS